MICDYKNKQNQLGESWARTDLLLSYLLTRGSWLSHCFLCTLVLLTRWEGGCFKLPANLSEWEQCGDMQEIWGFYRDWGREEYWLGGRHRNL